MATKEFKTAETRIASGEILAELGGIYPNLVVLGGDLNKSTQVTKFADLYPDRFFEMYIAEQNMVGAAIGLSRRGKTPFVSTFAAFFSRAFDQVRMCQYSDANIKFVGSHAGVSTLSPLPPPLSHAVVTMAPNSARVWGRGLPARPDDQLTGRSANARSAD